MKWLAYTTAKMGAWCVSDYETGKAIARMSDSCTSAENEKTARLIAAAPDLLAALEIALPYVESFDDDNADLQTKANAEAVRAAIAKAKGEQS
jgi:hypothetical protein